MLHVCAYKSTKDLTTHKSIHISRFAFLKFTNKQKNVIRAITTRLLFCSHPYTNSVFHFILIDILQVISPH